MFIRLSARDVPGGGCEPGYEADGWDQSLIASHGTNKAPNEGTRRKGCHWENSQLSNSKMDSEGERRRSEIRSIPKQCKAVKGFKRAKLKSMNN